MKKEKLKLPKCEICGRKMVLKCPNEWDDMDEKAYQKGVRAIKQEVKNLNV